MRKNEICAYRIYKERDGRELVKVMDFAYMKGHSRDSDSRYVLFKVVTLCEKKMFIVTGRILKMLLIDDFRKQYISYELFKQEKEALAMQKEKEKEHEKKTRREMRTVARIQRELKKGAEKRLKMRKRKNKGLVKN